MKDELTTILDAMRAAQAELADYLVSPDRNAELTIAKLVGILDRREVVRAMRLLRALERPGGAPQRTLPRRVDAVRRQEALRNQLPILQCGMKNPA